MKKIVLAFSLFFLTVIAQAQSTPDIVISATVDKVLAELEANRSDFKENPAKLYAMVEQHVLPVVDVEKVSKLVVGKYWKRSSVEQRNQFITEFKSFLMKSYAQGLFQYSGQKINYQPARYNDKMDKAIVDALLKTSDRNIAVAFKLQQGSDSNWRIYNVVADGINLVTNFRTSYTSIIQKQGMDGLINSLALKNKS